MDIEIRIIDNNEAQELMSSGKAGKAWKAYHTVINSRNYEGGKAIELLDRVREDFPYLTVLYNGYRPSKEFIVALDRDNKNYPLVGLLAMDCFGETGKEYDAITVVSTRVDYRGLGISKGLVEKVPELAIRRHLMRYDQEELPVILRLSGMETMGMERLTRSFLKTMENNPNLIIIPSHTDLGYEETRELFELVAERLPEECGERENIIHRLGMASKKHSVFL